MLTRLMRSAARNRVEAAGTLVVAVLLLCALIVPGFLPHDPLAVNLRDAFQPPSEDHWFGTDASGRDVFTRVLYGARVSLQVAALVISAACALGILVGGLAGYVGGLFDEVVMRLTDVFLAFPSLVLALAFATVFGGGLTSAMLAVALTWWPGYARIVRSQVLSVKALEYVEAARALGASPGRVYLRHVLPNSITPLIVQATLDVGYVILTTAGLSFLGVGAQPPTPEWGAMVAMGRDYVFNAWWIMTFPGLALFVTVVGFNLMGDWLRNELDPLRRRR